MKNIFIILFSLIGINVYSQFCPQLGPDQILPCGVNQATLFADLSACNQGGGPQQTTNYTVSNIPFQPVAPGGTQINLSDDSQAGPFPIGFNFCFFGQTYTQFWIGSNGWVSFSAGQPTTFTSQTIPSGSALVPKNCIMGPWQDWHPGVGGQIRYQTIGVAPCRRLVVTWSNMPMFSCTNLQGNFQIIIYEATNIIENHITNKPNCPQWAGGTAVQGLHNLPGNVGIVVPGRNSTQWTTQNNAWRWTPSGPPVVPTFTWYQVGNPVPIAVGPQTIQVTPPPGGANYTCHLTYGGCNTGYETCANIVGQGPDTVFVNTSPNLMNLAINTQDPICFGDCNGQITLNPSGGIAPYSYLWSPGSQQTQNISNLCQGNYNVTVTDVNGCQITSTINLVDPQQVIIPGVISHSDSPGGQFSTTNPDTVCFGSLNSVYTVNSVLGYNYFWQVNAPGIITSGQGSNTIQVDWSGVQPGLYQNAVSVMATDSNGCQSPVISIDVYIYQILPTIDQIGPFCSSDACQSIIVNPVGGIISGIGVIGNSFCPDSSIVGFSSINYQITSANCQFDTTIQVLVNPNPILSAIIQTPNDSVVELCDYQSSTITYTTISSEVGVYDWFIDNLNITNQSNSLTVTWTNWPLGQHSISVIQTSNNGCSSNIQQFYVTLVECPTTQMWAPNSFTPNGDGQNETWSPIGFNYKDVSYSIFNRWGQLIFESNDLSFGWNGTHKNLNCQEGVYVYLLNWTDIENKQYSKYGHIVLIR